MAAESLSRALRDGALEGEHAPALTIKDSIHVPLGPFVFNYVLTHLSSNISASKSQSQYCAGSFCPESTVYAVLKSKANDTA